MRMEVIHGSQIIPKADQQAFLNGVGERMQRHEQERQIQRQIQRRISRRLSDTPDRPSVARDMLRVESRIVCVVWTLARMPNNGGPRLVQKHGLEYFPERADIFANAVANGGWLKVASPPPPPDSKDIDEVQNFDTGPFTWFRLLDRQQAKLLNEAALTKCGDVSRNISWGRVKRRMPEVETLTIRTLQRRYETALRTIVAELTIARIV